LLLKRERSTCKRLRLSDAQVSKRIKTFDHSEYEYMRVCVFLENPRCIYRIFYALDPCDITCNVILTNFNKITIYLE